MTGQRASGKRSAQSQVKLEFHQCQFQQKVKNDRRAVDHWNQIR